MKEPVMKNVFFVVICLVTFSVLSNPKSNADKVNSDKVEIQTTDQQSLDKVNESAKHWLARLSHSLRHQNFNTSFVVIKNNQAEPYHWLHGIGEDGQELEIFTRLNGPHRDVLRQGGTVSYIQPEQEPYSIQAQELVSPIPDIFRQDINQLEKNYRFISVGRNRVLGRVAQFIRIDAKDKNRFNYWLWLDHQTNLLLKMAVVSPQGQVMEQLQFTHVEVAQKPSESLLQLQKTELPSLHHRNSLKHEIKLPWQVSWVPDGFKPIKSNRHRLHFDNQRNDRAVDFKQFSDGLVEVSVYVSLSHQKFREAEFANDGATIVFNQIIQGIEVGVVGDIPLTTAKKIAQSIVPADDIIDDLKSTSQGIDK